MNCERLESRRLFSGVSETDLQACLRVFDALNVSLGRGAASAQPQQQQDNAS